MTSVLFNPESYYLNLYGLPQLITAVFLQSLAVSILLSEKGSKVSWLFTLMTTVASGWLISTSLIILSAVPAVAKFWSYLCIISVCFIPFVMMLFVTAATDSFEKRKTHLRVSFGWSLLTALLTVTTPGMVSSIHRYRWGYFTLYGPLAPMHIAHTSLGVVFCLKWLWSHWSNAKTDPAKKRSRTFFFAFCSCSIAIIDVLPPLGVNIYPYGFLPVLGFCAIISWGILRYRIIKFSPAFAAEEMMSTMDDPLIVCDLNGTIRLANDACEDVFGFSEEELLNDSLDQLLAPAELGSKKLQTLKEGSLKDTEEFRFRNRKNEKIAVRTSVSRLTDEDDEPVGILIVARDIRQQKKAQEQIQELAFRDSITNLPNRRYLFKEFDTLTENIDDEQGALIYLGLPDFNEIKHTLGPQKTETLLTKLTSRFQALVDDSVELINWNEDEFILVDLSARTREEARGRAEQWLKTLNEPFDVDSDTFRLRASIGIALRWKHGNELDDLLTKADLARNRARKQSGRHIEIYEEGIQEKTNKRISLKNSLRSALNNEELDLVYHPIVSSSPREISRLEVLLRWNHPEEGFVPPPKIIAMAEELNILSKLGNWIFEQSCRDLSVLQDALNDQSLKLSINLSASQLQFHSQLLNLIDRELSRDGLLASNFIFEITETTAMQDIEFSRNVLRSIQDLGCSVAVDDFGTGHSSIQYLMDLPIDTLKIDKSFILDLFKDSKNRILVETMLFMAHQLDLDVVAEGVETERQRDFLVQNNCDYLQGFLWTKPLPIEDCIRFLEDWPAQTSPA